jgi:Transaldolase/Fructose-6-phosphate aldolase
MLMNKTRSSPICATTPGTFIAPHGDRPTTEVIMAQALQELAAAGVAVWLDDLSRPRIQSGSLARFVEQGDIVGITTNPTIFSCNSQAPPLDGRVELPKQQVTENRWTASD